MPQDLIPHVFERFRQGYSTIDRVHQGLGLGLAITKQLVELHGGTINASSQGEGLGSTFVVQFPLSPVRVEAANAGSGAGITAHTGGQPDDSDFDAQVRLRKTLEGLRVLLVEDEDASLEVLRMVLGKYNVKVAATKSAREALDSAKSDIFDVIVSDIGMPEMNGFDFLTELRRAPEARSAATPAIALTSHASESDRMRAIRVGFQAHVRKPVNLEHFLTVIGDVAQVRDI
jgi:CheY-like chemotaxis protein